MQISQKRKLISYEFSYIKEAHYANPKLVIGKTTYKMCSFIAMLELKEITKIGIDKWEDTDFSCVRNGWVEIPEDANSWQDSDFSQVIDGRIVEPQNLTVMEVDDAYGTWEDNDFSELKERKAGGHKLDDQDDELGDCDLPPAVIDFNEEVPTIRNICQEFEDIDEAEYVHIDEGQRLSQICEMYELLDPHEDERSLNAVITRVEHLPPLKPIEGEMITDLELAQILFDYIKLHPNTLDEAFSTLTPTEKHDVWNTIINK